MSLEMARLVKQVYAIDVSKEMTKGLVFPANFHLILSDGIGIPVPANSIDVAYSNNLVEHLHPDDAVEQLRNIHQALAPGGVYICVTPNRLKGPHDVSKYFDTVATGFHLKEYTVSELKAAIMSKIADIAKINILSQNERETEMERRAGELLRERERHPPGPEQEDRLPGVTSPDCRL